MRRIGIITLIDNNNYGNRLQNYAVQAILKKNDNDVETILNRVDLKTKQILKTRNKFIKIIKKVRSKIESIIYKKKISSRKKFFLEFNKKYIKSTENYITANSIPKNLNELYDIFVTGSDQVWNPNFKRLTKLELLGFAEPKKRISFAASFAVNEISEEKKVLLREYLKDFKSISVREEKAKEIIEKNIKRTDVEVLVDPTMLLTPEEWDKVSKKPEQLNFDKYILCYFLGELSEHRKKEIARVAKENNCKIINILDKKDLFYETGPSEFLYLEKNAFLICTDSFHSSVFAILYNRPFVVFDREDSSVKMKSRLDTLLQKFKLVDRWYKGEIKKEQLKTDYTKAYEILEKEREKSMNFLKRALDIE